MAPPPLEINLFIFTKRMMKIIISITDKPINITPKPTKLSILPPSDIPIEINRAVKKINKPIIRKIFEIVRFFFFA